MEKESLNMVCGRREELENSIGSFANDSPNQFHSFSEEDRNRVHFRTDNVK